MASAFKKKPQYMSPRLWDKLSTIPKAAWADLYLDSLRQLLGEDEQFTEEFVEGDIAKRLEYRKHAV